MKKVVILCSLVLFIVCGCGKFDADKALSEFKNDVESSKSYLLTGTMEIRSDEDTFTYSLEAGYKKDNMYKVTLINQTNNHEQIILKNKDGVYVVSPNLNKSFKFQSEWPDNSSQAYLLGSLLKDLEKMKTQEMEEKDGHYILKATVKYPNNPDLSYEKIYFSKDMEPERVEVYSNDDILKIKVNFTKVNYKANLDEEYFSLDGLIDENCCGEENNNSDAENNNEGPSSETNGLMEDIIYPLYIPANTYLNSKETIDTDNGERVILTFSGEKSFVLVEEKARAKETFEVIPVYGDPLIINDTIAALSANSLTWTSNNIEYYLAGADLTTAELLTIAQSLSNTMPSGK